jgi:hypothetical protein
VSEHATTAQSGRTSVPDTRTSSLDPGHHLERRRRQTDPMVGLVHLLQNSGKEIRLRTTPNTSTIAPAQLEDIDIGGDTVRCLKNGLWHLRGERGP